MVDRMEERLTDVTIVGGGAAGLAAALQLGRIGRSVVVIDGGNPRNAPAAHMHGFPGFDGVAPGEFLGRARDDLEPYGVEVLAAQVVSIDDAPGPRPQFVVHTDAGRVIRSRRLLITTGLTDELPDVPGLADHWGREVIHCPWCHGWEVKAKRIVVMDTGYGAHQAVLFSQLSNDVTLIDSDAAVHRTNAELEQLARLGVRVDPRRAAGISVDAASPVRVELADGGVIEADTVVVGVRFHANVAVLAGLHAEVVEHSSGFGESLQVDTWGQTTHRGIYAAGNVTDPMQQVLHAAAAGSTVAGSVTADLLAEEATFGRGADAATTEAERAEWDARYAEYDGLWSGEPNGTLVHELDGAGLGRALDVGCGEGADAVWLAQRGWEVTAVDVSELAIGRAIEAGSEAAVDVVWQCRDLIAEPPHSERYDLVTVSYPAFVRDRGLDVARQLVDAVAPGGEILVVGHAVEDHDPETHGFDPLDYISVADFRNSLDDRFDIVVDETRSRPNVPAGAHHHGDQVLRAKRPS